MEKKHVLLVILDGFGYSEESEHNAIAKAQTPHWDTLINQYPNCLISSSGLDVGLPDKQMGNSEVGHMNIGAGRVIYQDFTRITQDIVSGKFETNPVFQKTLTDTHAKHGNIHILGLFSSGGVHSHEDHLYAMIETAKKAGAKNIYLHCFLDGRDTPPTSAIDSIKKLHHFCEKEPHVFIASLVGRYFAMDRDNRWDRIQKAYDLLTLGKAKTIASDAVNALRDAYAQGETDEFIQPIAITHNDRPITINDRDSIFFMNFRSDRARELTRAFIDNTFNGFQREKQPKLTAFVSLTQYDVTLDTRIAYPPQSHKNILSEILSNAGLTQLRIAETEKYAHVTFFFNGGVETPWPGEERCLIPSAKVATYDLKPEMSAFEVTEKLVDAIQSEKFDVMICNFANPDMVGHTGKMDATIKAIEVIDACLKKITQACLSHHTDLLITADHGNAEKMFDEKTQQTHTAHTADPIPFMYVGERAKLSKINGKLADISPTILFLLGLIKPDEMTGQSLLVDKS